MGMFDWLNPQPDAEEQERAKQRQRAAEQRARDIERQRNAAAYVSVVDQAMAVAPMVTAAQGNHLTKMAEDVNEAIEKENDSRVSQLREMRRMQHEKDLKRMEMDALIQRLGSAGGAAGGGGESPRYSGFFSVQPGSAISGQGFSLTYR